MARELNMDTQRQNFLKEAFMKETLIRLSWYIDNKDSLQKAKEHWRQVQKKPTKLPPLQTDKRNEKELKSRTKDTKKDKAVLEKGNTIQVDQETNQMRPVSVKTKNLLYQGVSREDNGRKHYLKTRKLKKPEDRYLFPLTTSWEYGWQLGKKERNN
ncbi:protein ATP6V1FNB [Protopterus annectens]|uniref:protein ATP6V1FNB n=1 Tax=Protopterus annectens TaxID=7888 RepID=UPI001CF96585|nr:protein ATP6V1FNB [Protopterus annectens]